jgi:hypothetical protein
LRKKSIQYQSDLLLVKKNIRDPPKKISAAKLYEQDLQPGPMSFRKSRNAV